MRVTFFALAIILATVTVSCTSSLASAEKIKNVVALMFENRPFCHLFSGLKELGLDVDACDPKTDFNEYKGKRYDFNYNATYIAAYDPDHSWSATTTQLMGNADAWINPAPMNGFVKQAAEVGHPEEKLWTSMSGFPAHKIPGFTTLAREYGVFNNMYASFPGETVINRLFFHLGQCDSHVTTGEHDLFVIEGFAGKSIYDVMTEHNISWKIYFVDIPDVFYTKSIRTFDKIIEHLRFIEDFHKDAKEGNLPEFAFVSPRYYSDLMHLQPQDMHPQHNVAIADKFMSDIYNSVRNGPQWNNSLLLVTEDENGGLFDKVPPPQNVPNPFPGHDSTDTPKGLPPFNFTRLGLRVPAMLISPLIPKASVFREPKSAHYEHSSIFNTLKELWPEKFGDAKPLSARQAWAASFADLVTLDTPRTDCPSTVPHAPQPTKEENAKIANAPVGDLQKEFFLMLNGVLHHDARDEIDKYKTKAEMGEHVKKLVKKIIANAHREAKLRGRKDLLRDLEKYRKDLD